MSWYRNSDGKIVTDEEYRNGCMECECFCQEGMVNIPCNGERTDCPYFKEVDTSDYDRGIRNKAIEEFLEKICNTSELARPVGWSTKQEIVQMKRVQEIAERMKEV